MGAGSGDPIGVDAVSVQDLGSMAQYGDAAAAQDQRLLDDLQNSDDRLAAHHDRLEDGAGGHARHAPRRGHRQRREVVKVNAATMKLLDSTNASVKLLATQIEQKAEAAAAIAERAWLKQFAAEQAARRHGAPGIGVPPPDPTVPADPGVPPGDLKPPVPGALLAVAYARAQLGKPYVYAAAGPAAFDCSGLTMMAWAQSGVSMEHGSQAQWEAFPRFRSNSSSPAISCSSGYRGPRTTTSASSSGRVS